jgi:hypothetical protein
MSTKPADTRPTSFSARARFVLVRDRVPRIDANCARCAAQIESGYVREPQTRLAYCNLTCFTGRGKVVTNTVAN